MARTKGKLNLLKPAAMHWKDLLTLIESPESHAGKAGLPSPNQQIAMVCQGSLLVQIQVSRPWSEKHLRALVHSQATQPTQSTQTNETNQSEEPAANHWWLKAKGVSAVQMQNLRTQLRWDRHGKVLLDGAPNDGQIYFDPQEGFLRVYNPQNKSAYWVRQSSDELPFWEAHMPFREFWHVLAILQSKLLTHAAIIVHQGQGILLIGASGAGKSTLCLEALNQGWQTVGDDYVLLESRHGQLFGSRQFLTLKQKSTGDHRRLAVNQTQLPDWSHTKDTQQGKIIYYPHQEDPVWAADAVPIRWMVAPSHQAPVNSPGFEPQPQQGPQLVALSQAEVLKMLAPNQIFQCPVLAPQAFMLTRTLSGLVPGFRLDTRCGPGPAVAMLAGGTHP